MGAFVGGHRGPHQARLCLLALGRREALTPSSRLPHCSHPTDISCSLCWEVPGAGRSPGLACQTPQCSPARLPRGVALPTFIMSTMVLRAIMAMMVYSNGGDTTNCHMRYWKLCLFCGMWRVSGLALMAKSMQALCGVRYHERGGTRIQGAC